MPWLGIRLLAVVLTLLVPVAAAHAAVRKDPPGAVRLKASLLKKVPISAGKSIQCGRLGSVWHSGTILRSGRFISDSQQAKNFRRLAARAKGKKRRAYLRKAKTYRDRKRHTKTCRMTRGGGAAPGTSAPPKVPLRFNLAGAAGLALRGATAQQSRVARTAQASSTNNMVVVTEDGMVREAASSGTAAIQRVLIAPNGTVYVIFKSPTNPENSGQYDSSGCLLAEVDRASGVPKCIDGGGLHSIIRTSAGQNPAVQWDASGAVYFAGMIPGGMALRRYANGTATDLITGEIMLADFLVGPDGSVFLNGQTGSTGASWLRRLTPSGGLQSLGSHSSRFLRHFPDGNVYMGLWGGDAYGVRRFLTSTGQVESKYWIAGNGNGGTPERYFDTAPFCEGESQSSNYAFCGWSGTHIRATFTTSDEKVFAIAGDGGAGLLMQYFPVLAKPQTAVVKATLGRTVGDKIALAGLNASGQHVLRLHDTTTGEETELIGPDREIEIYHLNYVAGRNRLMFDGLRFSDNKYVLGQIDLATKEISFPTTSASKWDEFVTFG